MGDESLQNISLLASLQSMDVKQACEALSATPIGRTKRRVVHAVARLKFDMDPIYVGAPAPEVPVAEAKSRLRVEGRAALKVKVSSIMDQSSDLEIERAPPEKLRVLRARFRSLEVEDPMKSEEVTDDQLSVMSALVKAGVAPYADLGCGAIWSTHSQEFETHFSLPRQQWFMEVQRNSRT